MVNGLELSCMLLEAMERLLNYSANAVADESLRVADALSTQSEGETDDNEAAKEDILDDISDITGEFVHFDNSMRRTVSDLKTALTNLALRTKENALFQVAPSSHHPQYPALQREAEQIERDSNRIRRDLREIAGPLQADPIFMHLWNRRQGTSEYRGSAVSKMSDHLLAKASNYQDSAWRKTMVDNIEAKLAKSLGEARQKASAAKTVETERAIKHMETQEARSHLRAWKRAERAVARKTARLRTLEDLWRRSLQTRLVLAKKTASQLDRICSTPPKGTIKEEAQLWQRGMSAITTMLDLIHEKEELFLDFKINQEEIQSWVKSLLSGEKPETAHNRIVPASDSSIVRKTS